MATTWTNKSKVAPQEQELLLIGDTFNLLIGEGFNLEIQYVADGTSWSNNSRTASTWTNLSKN